MTKDAPPSYDSLYPPGQAATDYGAYGSNETVKSELSIFDGPSYQVTHVKANYLEIAPSNQYQGTGEVDVLFKIVGAPGWYLNFQDSYMILTCKIEDDAGKAVTDQLVAFENFPLATLFKDVTFSTSNQTKLEGENQAYSYRTYLYVMLNASSNSKKYQLGASGWAHDDPDSLDTLVVAAAGSTAATGNQGFWTRRDWTKSGGTLQVIGPLFLDTWIQSQYFLDNQDFHLKFQRNSPEFALHANDSSKKYKINLLDMKLFIRQVQVSPSVVMGHIKGLANSNAVFKYNGHKLYTKLIKSGGMQDRTDDLCAGVHPKAIILGLVEHESYCGKLEKSPYNFQHFNVNRVELTNNTFHLPGSPMTPNFEKQLIAREYYHMFLALGKQGVFNDDNGITMKNWAHGSTLFCFNLAPDSCLSGHSQPAKLTNIVLTLSFAKPIDKPIQLICLAIYDTHIEMTGNRLWQLDPTQAAN
jgi:hypothetical protein